MGYWDLVQGRLGVVDVLVVCGVRRTGLLDNVGFLDLLVLFASLVEVYAVFGE